MAQERPRGGRGFADTVGFASSSRLRPWRAGPEPHSSLYPSDPVGCAWQRPSPVHWVHSSSGHKMAAHPQGDGLIPKGGVEGEPLHKEGLPHAPLGPCWSPAAHHDPQSALAILTEESTAVEADGGLAGHLGSIKDCIVELVREGKGLWASGGKFRVKLEGVTAETFYGRLPSPRSRAEAPGAVQHQNLDYLSPSPIPGLPCARTEGSRFLGARSQGRAPWDLGCSRACRVWVGMSIRSWDWTGRASAR